MKPGVRDTVEADVIVVTALYDGESLGGTATFETTPPTLTEMTDGLRRSKVTPCPR